MTREGVAAVLVALALAVACDSGGDGSNGNGGSSKAGESCAATSDCQGDLRCVGQVCTCQCDAGQTCDASGTCVLPNTGDDVVSSDTAGSETSTATTSIDWVSLPGGTYQMGSNDGQSDEKPVHSVTLSGFKMARTETTVAQYKACVDAQACTEATAGGSCNWGVTGKDDHPINCVDWNQAKTYCTWAGARLCTEAEWEYAARSGGKNQTYAWGDEEATCDYAVMDDNGDGCGTTSTWAVCSKTAGNSEQGVCDLAGNVWEWVADWYDDYPSDSQTDPTGPASGSSRVLRGGSWAFYAGSLRAARRSGDYPGDRYDNLGLRCCRSSN